MNVRSAEQTAAAVHTTRPRKGANIQLKFTLEAERTLI